MIYRSEYSDGFKWVVTLKSISLDDAYDWCKKTFGEEYPRSYQSGYAIRPSYTPKMFFNNEADALLFELTWCYD